MARIAILGAAYPFRGGLAAYNERLARQFELEGHEVRIFTFTLQYPGFLFPGKSQYSEDSSPEGLQINRTLSSVNPFSWFTTAKKINAFKPDFLIIKYWLPFMGPAFGTVARKVGKNGKTRVVSILDNVIPHEKRPGDVSFTRYFLAPVDGFIAMSDSVLKDLRTFTPDKPARLIPHPLYDNFGDPVAVHEARQYLGLPAEGRLILFFGFIRDYKGLDYLIEAMALLKENPVKLLVAGEFYTDPDPYHAMINAAGLQDKIILRTDFIPDAEVKYYFSAADLVVQPYKSATQSGVTQIALHFNKPMVVTDVGGLAEMLPDGKAGFTVKPDSAAIADAISRFYELPPGHFSKGIQELKVKYDWSALTGAILNLFR